VTDSDVVRSDVNYIELDLEVPINLNFFVCFLYAFIIMIL